MLRGSRSLGLPSYAGLFCGVSHMVRHGSFFNMPGLADVICHLYGEDFTGRMHDFYVDDPPRGFNGRVVLRQELLPQIKEPITDTLRYFLRLVRLAVCKDDGVAEDLLIIQDSPGGEELTRAWLEVLQLEGDACTGKEHLMEAAEGGSPLHDYCRLLEGCGWGVWRVRSSNMQGKYLRIMVRQGGGDSRVSLAVHLQLCDDCADGGRAVGNDQ